jgi:hypothetical protein
MRRWFVSSARNHVIHAASVECPLILQQRR